MPYTTNFADTNPNYPTTRIISNDTAPALDEQEEPSTKASTGAGKVVGLTTVAVLAVAMMVAAFMLARQRKHEAGVALNGGGDVVVNQAYADTVEEESNQHLLAFPWYVGAMPKVNCNALVRAGWKGQFLVRNSNSAVGRFAGVVAKPLMLSALPVVI